MLPIIKIENERGEVLNLSTDPRYTPLLTGTGPPPATINRAKASTSDGTNVNSTTVDERPLVLQVLLKKDIAKARLNLYRWLATKKKITVYYSCDGLDVFTQGYVETVDADPWQQNQFVQASIICPRPYWREMAETYTNASNVEALFEFPFFTDCVYRCGLNIYGKTIQSGTPSPDAPVPLESAGDGGMITITAGAQSVDISTPNGLPGIPVTSGGNYTDGNGQQWICDEMDFARGVYVQRVGKVVFDGSADESIEYTADMTTACGGWAKIALPYTAKSDNNVTPNVLSNRFTAVKNNTGVFREGVCTMSSSKKHIAFVSSMFSSVDTARTWFMSNPTVALYEMETPIETALSAEQLAAYDALEIGDDTALTVSEGNFSRSDAQVIDVPGVELSTVSTETSTIIENTGTVEAGVTFIITATTPSTNPRIHNLSTGEFIGFWTELQPGDRLEVCTLTGSKEVTHIRDGVRTNCINTMMEGSQWLQMAIGANEYSYTVDDGECELGIYYTNEYVGV